MFKRTHGLRLYLAQRLILFGLYLVGVFMFLKTSDTSVRAKNAQQGVCACACAVGCFCPSVWLATRGDCSLYSHRPFVQALLCLNVAAFHRLCGLLRPDTAFVWETQGHGNTICNSLERLQPTSVFTATRTIFFCKTELDVLLWFQLFCRLQIVFRVRAQLAFQAV